MLDMVSACVRHGVFIYKSWDLRVLDGVCVLHVGLQVLDMRSECVSHVVCLC